MPREELAQNFSTQHSSETSARKPPLSERKVEANRRNARCSTGPKTARGKRIVARNAIKHGLLAREVVITAGEGKENRQDFDKLVEGLRKHYEPVGVVEESLVDTIVTCLWRKARILRAENGEIRKRLDTALVDRALRASDKVNLHLALTEGELGWFDAENQGDDKLASMERWSIMQRTAINLRGHRSGLAYLAGLLEQAKSELATAGHISEGMGQKLMLAFGLCDFLFTLTCLRAIPHEARTEGQPADGNEDKRSDQKLPDLTREFIDDRLDWINLLQEYTKEREELESDAEARSFSLPPAEVSDKLLRYEAHVDRQLYRAMDQLERIQRLRNGEKVPPPLHLNLSRKG